MPLDTTNFYLSVFKEAPNLFLILDDTGVLKNCNNHIKDLLGYKPDELKGEQLKKIVHPEYKEKAYAKLNNFDDSLAPYYSYLELMEVDGERVPTNVRIKEVPTEGERPHRTLWTFEEIAERQLEDLEIKLKRLKKRNEDLEELTRVLSHDLREPVRSIYSYVDLLLERQGEELSSESRQRLSSVKENAIQIKNLTDDLSEISELRTDSSLQLISIPEIVSEVVEELKEWKDKFELEVQEDYPRVHFDPDQMKILLKNLIANSIKFNKDPKKIIVGYKNPDPGDEIELFVEDNGEGVPEEHQSRIFETFRVLGSQTNPGTTGIGLAISKRIVEESGGEIWLESEPGEGTTVYFTVPIYENPDEADGSVPEFTLIPESPISSVNSDTEFLDPQTGLHNHHYFERILIPHLKSYCENGDQLRFLLVRLEKYGKLERRYTEEVRRDFLNQLTTLFMGSIRQSDLILRFSKSDYLFVLPGMSSEVGQVKNRISSRISEWKEDPSSPDWLVQLSYGSSLISAQNDPDLRAALKESERKLYKERD